MALVMDRPAVIEPEAVLDLVNGTWTCVEHGTVMDILSGEDCPKCLKDASEVHAPPDHW